MSVEFLWDGRAQPTRGPKPALSLDRIADAAIAVADAEGLAAVSMQRVAADLGYTKMSLYRYLPGKAELVAVMVERVMDDPPALDPAQGRESLAAWTRALMAAFLRHPWSLAATVGARPIGPRELGWMESALTVLAGLPLSGAERLDAMVVLVGHARALAEQITGAQGDPEQGLAAVVQRHSEGFPQVAAAMAEAAEKGERDQAFDFGLARILDGLDVLIARRAVDGSAR